MKQFDKIIPLAIDQARHESFQMMIVIISMSLLCETLILNMLSSWMKLKVESRGLLFGAFSMRWVYENGDNAAALL